MNFSRETKILAGIYAIVALGWLFFIFLGQHETWIGDYYQFAFLLVDLAGFVLVLRSYLNIRKDKSPVGLVSLVFSFSLLFWSCGWLTSALTFFTSGAIAGNPGAGDVFYLMTWTTWIIGLYLLLRVTKIRVDLVTLKSKVGVVLVPALLFSINLFLLISSNQNPFLDFWSMTTLVDIFYTAADVVIMTLISLLLLRSEKYLGLKFQSLMGILFVAYVMIYVSDLALSQAMKAGTFFNGHFTDMLYTTAVFLIAVVIANINQGAGAYLFGQTSDIKRYQEQITRIWYSMKDMHLTLDEIFRALATQIKVGKIAVFMRDEQTLSYLQLHSLGEEKDSFDRKDPLVLKLQSMSDLVTMNGCLQRQSETLSEGEREHLEELIRSFIAHRLQMIIPLQKSANPIAFLAVGPKVFGNAFSAQDLDKIRETASVIEKMVVNKYSYESVMAKGVIE